jgi:hypothetical protein
MSFKVSADRWHRIPKQRQEFTNWAEYDPGLRARGSLTVWFTAKAIEGWHAEARIGWGGQAKYSDLAIATALTPHAVFRLALRQTEPYGQRHPRIRCRRASYRPLLVPGVPNTP